MKLVYLPMMDNIGIPIRRRLMNKKSVIVKKNSLCNFSDMEIQTSHHHKSNEQQYSLLCASILKTNHKLQNSVVSHVKHIGKSLYTSLHQAEKQGYTLTIIHPKWGNIDAEMTPFYREEWCINLKMSHRLFILLTPYRKSLRYDLQQKLGKPVKLYFSARAI